MTTTTSSTPAGAIDATLTAATGAEWARGARHPLGVIHDNAQKLLRLSPGNLPDAQRAALNTILEQACRLSHLVETLDTIAPRRGAVALPTVPPIEVAPLSSILLAEDDEDVLCALVDILSPCYQLTVARDGAETIAALRRRSFDLGIFDVGLPILDGFHLVKALRAEGRQLPTFMYLSARSDPRTKVQALALGAVDYVTKPFEPDELLARVAGILATVTREGVLRADARTDPMTGLGNYKGFGESLDGELERARRYGLPLSLLTIDVDDLKSINDVHGHEAGNEAIRMVAGVLAQGVRRYEVVARQGGDEFAIVLPNTAAAEARQLAERLRGEVGARTLHGAALSVSIGGASWEHKGPIAASELIEASDEALYRAKRAGRNRVEVAVLARRDS
jgi:diguanylate cyclase (GGDEF)-like protein